MLCSHTCKSSRWVLSNHTCVPAMCAPGCLSWQRTICWSRKRSLHVRGSLSQIDSPFLTPHKYARNIIFFLPPCLHSFSSSSSSLNVLVFCSHIFWRTRPCERRSLFLLRIRRQSDGAWHASPWVTGDADAHFRRWVGATEPCWLNNADRRQSRPPAAFIKQDRDDEQRSVLHKNMTF